MVFVEPTNLEVLALKGLHLYHAGRSNCSGRVRLLLEEKNLPWESHQIRLEKRENVTEEYFGINPKGVVPALVHDGRVITESNDILAYVEEEYPTPSFREVAADAQPEIDRWLTLSGDSHMPGIKTIQYYKRNPEVMRKTEEEVTLYRQLQTDPAYLEFHGKHEPGRSFSAEDAQGATNLMDGIFVEMEKVLSEHQWLVGDTYTLADISWAPSITTLLADEHRFGPFDFDPYPNLTAWYERIIKRPAYQTSIFAWRTPRWDDD